jgi:hypothetical protein
VPLSFFHVVNRQLDAIVVGIDNSLGESN